jgi:hypothetical protein
LRFAVCGFIESENPAFTPAPLARDSSPTINPQSAIRNPQSEDSQSSIFYPRR